MKKIFIKIIFLITIVFFVLSNMAMAYIPEVGPDVCAFRCDESTQLCAPGCPPRPGGDGGGDYSEANGPGPVFFGFMIVAFILVIAIIKGKGNIQLPQNQPPTPENPPNTNPPATQPTATASATQPPSQSDKPKTDKEEKKEKTESNKKPRKFRPVYSKKTAKNNSGGRKMGKI